jgi:hypothetical protein
MLLIPKCATCFGFYEAIIRHKYQKYEKADLFIYRAITSNTNYTIIASVYKQLTSLILSIIMPQYGFTIRAETCSICVISGFQHEVDEKCTLLDYYTTSSGTFLPTFRDNLLVPLSRVKNWIPGA